MLFKIYGMLSATLSQKKDLVEVMPVRVSNLEIPVLVEYFYLIMFLVVRLFLEAVNAVKRDRLFILFGHGVIVSEIVRK